MWDWEGVEGAEGEAEAGPKDGVDTLSREESDVDPVLQTTGGDDDTTGLEGERMMGVGGGEEERGEGDFVIFSDCGTGRDEADPAKGE